MSDWGHIAIEVAGFIITWYGMALAWKTATEAAKVAAEASIASARVAADSSERITRVETKVDLVLEGKVKCG